MPKTATDIKLQDRAARARLKPRHHPYWRSISDGRHVGYYRGKLGGSWIARCRSPDDRDYVTKPLGTADDVVDANGETILDWKQALEVALDWFRKVETPGYLEAANLTVQTAVEEYATMRDARDSARKGRPVRSDGRSRLTRYVKVDEQLAAKLLYELTEADLKAWRARIPGLILLGLRAPRSVDRRGAIFRRHEGLELELLLDAEGNQLIGGLADLERPDRALAARRKLAQRAGVGLHILRHLRLDSSPVCKRRSRHRAAPAPPRPADCP